MKRLTVVAIGCALAMQIHAATPYNVGAGQLQNELGNPVAQNSLAMVVVSTLDSTFQGPTPNAFVSGDDVIVATFGVGINGELSGFVNINYTGNINAGDPLALFWFPTRSLVSPSPGWSTPYGFYTSATGQDNSAPWILPADLGNLYDIYAYSPLFDGTVSQSDLRASMLTIPEPTTCVLVGFGLLGAWFMRRRSR